MLNRYNLFGSLWLILEAPCEKELWLRWMMDCTYLVSRYTFYLPYLLYGLCTRYKNKE